MKENTVKLFNKLFLLSFVFFSYNQISHSQDIIWEKTENFDVSVLAKVKLKSLVYNLKADNLEQKLNSITENRTGELYFPLGEKGEVFKFIVKETKVMHPDLVRKFPNIKSYKGVSLDGSKRIIRFTYSSNNGFYGVLENTIHEKIEIKPINKLLHEFINTSSQIDNSLFECQTEDLVRKQMTSFGAFDRNIDDGNLRRYRLALSVSGDYSQVFLDGTETDDDERKAKVLQAMVNSVNRLNGIFERDFGVTMQLIADANLLIFLDPSTDPYFVGGNLRDALVTTIANTISDSDYDVGHLFHKESNNKYGNAGCIACVCRDGEKGQAYSVHGSPDTDDMNLLAAHEFGHQFGAYHTQSSSVCRSGFNSEVEPGSGSTIMSYAGICSPNVQAGSDDYFNYTSIRDVALWTIDNSSCAELIPTGNLAPVVSQGLDYIIPKSTPFVLEGNASDSDVNDTLSYCWEQNDPEDPQDANTPFSTRVFGPMFRSFPPSYNSKRYFPNLADVVANNLTPTWEVLPSISRELNFVMTVRDNGIDGGQTVSDAVTINVEGNAGPFTVTSQQDISKVWKVGGDVTVIWDVAGTDLAPINVSKVEILLSLDAGETFSTTLITTANDGEETFSLPDVDATTAARIMVKAVDNVFFALNQQNFAIQKSEYAIFSEEASINVCDVENTIFNLEYKTFLEFNETVNLSLSNLPDGVSATFSDDAFSGVNLSGTPFSLTLTGVGNLDLGDYTFDVEGLSMSNVEKSITLSFTVFTANNSTLSLVAPLNNADSQEIDIEFSWVGDDNSVSYDLEIATDDTFTNVIENVSTENTIYKSLNIENNNTYYWRVKSVNPCGDSNYSEVYSFSTQCSIPENFTVVNRGFNEVEVSWDDSPTNDSWTIEYGETGFVLGEGLTSDLSLKEFKAESLISGTLYDFYVKGNCSIGGKSLNTGPFTVATKYDYCSGDHFYDTGGANGVYQNNEYIITQIYPDINENRVRVSFNTFNLESYRDYIYVFDGESSNDNYLGSYTDTQLQGVEFASKHESGALTFIFISNSETTALGWDATVVCEDKPNCFEPTGFSNTFLSGKEATFEWTSVGDDANWELEYGELGFMRGNGTIITSAVESVIVENLNPLTSYEIYIKTICDIGGFSEILGPYEFSTTELCSTPLNLIMTSLTNDTARANWDNLNGSVTNWEVEYGISGFSQGSGTTIEVTEKTVLMEGLNSNSDYQLYVRSNCELVGDGFSNWAGPVNFKTTPDYCNGDHFYDSGGESGNYLNGENITTVIYPKTIDERIRVVFNSFSVETCCDRIRVYDGPNIQSPLIGTYNSDPGMFISSHETGALTFLFTSDGSSTRSGWDATVICEDKPNCLYPIGLGVSSVQARQVDLSWLQSDNEANWTIEYGLAEFTLGEGTELISTTLNKTITDLVPDTTYEVYIKANCTVGGFSDWSSPLSFRTNCEPLLAPYKESFIMTNSLPDCWSQSENGNWNFNTYAKYDAGNVQDRNVLKNSNYAWLDSFNSAFNGDYMLKSPWVDISTLTNPAIMFSAFSKNTITEVYNTLNVTLYDSNGVSFTNIVTVNNNTSIWKDFVIDLSNYAFTSNEIQIEFKITLNTDNRGYYNDILIDEVSFDELPSCTNPINPEVVNITGRSAELSWDSTDDETNWEIQYGFSGFTPAGATTVFTTENPYVFIGLEEQRLYDVYIRAVCGIGDSSEFIGPIVFTTTELCPKPSNFRFITSTKNSAQLSWDDVEEGAEWELEYGVDFFPPRNGIIVTVSNGLINLENLLPDTNYNAFLRRNCGVDGYSNESWVSFNTEVACNEPVNFRTTTVTKNNATFNWDNKGEASEWEIEYHTNYFNPSTGVGISQVITTNSVTLENLLPDTLYYAYLRSNCGADGYSNWTGYYAFYTPVACSVPFNFRNTAVTKNSVTLNWDDNGDATEWEIEYDTSYFNPGDGVGIGQVTTTNSVSLDNLLSNTLYYVYLRSNCGADGYSNWTWYYTFRTSFACSIPTNFRMANSTLDSAILSWDDSDETVSWELEYSQTPFNPGSGTRINTSTNSIEIENLQSNTLFYAYLRSDCQSDGYSDWTTQINFATLCDPEAQGDNLIVNGSFECGSLAGWELGGPNIFTGCIYNFAVLTNSSSVCGNVSQITPIEGEYAAFTSFDGNAGTVYSLSQRINVPGNLDNALSANISYNFKVNYEMTYNNPTAERVFKASFTDLSGVELFQVDELRFGISPNTGEIVRAFSHDILSDLRGFEGETILLNFQAYVPETSTGPSKALIDDVSLVVDNVLSISNNEFSTSKLLVYPIPNKGKFTVTNKNGGKIEVIEVFDVSGRLIQREKLITPVKQLSVDIQNVNSGVYFVKVRIDGTKYSKRIIVE